MTYRTDSGKIGVAEDPRIVTVSQDAIAVGASEAPPTLYPDPTTPPPLTDGRRVMEMQGEWYVARTRRDHEKVYAAELWRISRHTGGAVGFLLPTVIRRSRSSHHGWENHYRPMYPGIIFVCVADHSISLDPNQRTYPQLAMRVPPRSQPILQHDLVKVELAAMNDPLRLDVMYPFAQVGRRVRILDGMFQGQVAPVIEADHSERKIVLEIVMLGRVGTYTLPEHVKIEPIE